MTSSKKLRIRKPSSSGPTINDITTVMYWYRNGYFANEDEARGAFRLAYQQGLDGLGPSTHDWMGMTEAEFERWMDDETLPPRRKFA